MNTCFLDTRNRDNIYRRPPSFRRKGDKLSIRSSHTVSDSGHIGFMVVDVGIIFEGAFEKRPCSNMMREFIGDNIWQHRALVDIMQACAPDTIYFGCLEQHRKIILIMVDWKQRFSNEKQVSESLESTFSNDAELGSARKMIRVHEMRSFPFQEGVDSMKLLNQIIDEERAWSPCSHCMECSKMKYFKTN